MLLVLFFPAFHGGHFDCWTVGVFYVYVWLGFFLKIEMFFLLLREEKSPAKLIKKITCYRLGDPDVLFQVQEGSCDLAEMEHKQRKKQWERDYQARGKWFSRKSL